jgi:predicted SpoU family rRNA methylase
MKNTILIILLIFIYNEFALGQTLSNSPIMTPSDLGDFDKLSKFTLRTLNGKSNENLSRKKNQNHILGTIIEDPRVVFSTYCGGNGYDCGNSLAVDSKGDVYTVGYTGSTNFPVSDNAFQKEKKNGHDMFIGKFSSTGQRVWLTYLGGNGTDVATDCICDKNDNLIVVGKTDSQDFPTTAGVEQEKAQGSIDVVLVKFDPNGNLIWSRYYGGSRGELGEGIALCSNGIDFVITGTTLSREFPDPKPEWNSYGLPITKGTYQDTLATWRYNTAAWNSDAFVSKFDENGKMIWGTFFGGQQQEASHAIAVDKNDNVAIVGETKRIDVFATPVFPVTPDAFKKDTCRSEDIFYAKFNNNGHLVFSTIFCGETDNIYDDVQFPSDFATDVKFDNYGNTIFCGYTNSKLFPTTKGAYKEKYDSPDAILVKFGSDNQRIWSTYFGGVKSGSYGNNDFIYKIRIYDNEKISSYLETYCSDFILSTDALLNMTGGAVFVKFNEIGYPTWLSGFWDRVNDFYIYSLSDFYIMGITQSPKFPITKNAFQPGFDPDKTTETTFLMNVNMNRTSVYDNYRFLDYDILYPNPVISGLHINYHTLNSFTLNIYNVLGIKIKTLELNPNSESNYCIDVSDLSSGVYYVSIFDIYRVIICKFIRK